MRRAADVLLVTITVASIACQFGYGAFVVILGSHVVGFASSSIQAQQNQASPHSPLDDVEKVFKILAYIVGACWIYFNYFRGRTYRNRLEPHVTGELCRRTDREMIRAVVKVKNVGLSKVDIQQKGSGLRFLIWDASEPSGWRHLTTKSVLEHHEWIEPGETVEDHLVIAADLRHISAVKLDLSLTTGQIMWQAVSILT